MNTGNKAPHPQRLRRYVPGMDNVAAVSFSTVLGDVQLEIKRTIVEKLFAWLIFLSNILAALQVKEWGY